MQWSPRGGETAALAAVAIGLALSVVLLDAAGRVLVGTAAVLLLLVVAHDLRTRPRLRAGPDGVDVRTWTGRRHLPWPLLRVRVRVTRRLGISSRTLELDTAAGPDDDGVLVVLGRRDLGADPEVVARTLRELDPTRPLDAQDGDRRHGQREDQQDDGERGEPGDLRGPPTTGEHQDPGRQRARDEPARGARAGRRRAGS